RERDRGTEGDRGGQKVQRGMDEGTEKCNGKMEKWCRDGGEGGGMGGGMEGLLVPQPPGHPAVPRVTLRRASSGKSRKEKSSNRLSVGSREVAEPPSRPSGSPFLPFSWFSDSARGSGSPSSLSPAGSPRHEGLSPAKSASQDSTLSEDSPPSSASPRLPGPPKCSYPYHTLSQSSDELLEEPPGAAAGWTCGQVGQWLQSLGLEQYVDEFSAHGVDGPRLLHLDGAKLKVWGWG
ncbi:SAM14 protein, partial [Grantiella picta]|nr:SAM14 protein [Grantiella picta]